MRHAIRLLVCCFLLSACESAPPGPIDAIYRVHVEELENTCNDFTIPSDITALLDVFLRSDGGNDLRWVTPGSLWVPQEFTYVNVRPADDGRVDHVEIWNPAPERSYERSAVGTLTRDDVDLELTVNSDYWDGEKRVPCVRRARIAGSPRPIFDPESHDGRYRVLVTSYLRTCPGDAEPSPDGSWYMVMDVSPFAADKTSFTIEDANRNILKFIPQMPITGDMMDWEGGMFIADGGGITQLEGKVRGTLDPDAIDLTIVFRLEDDTSGCEYRYDLTGAKRIPSLDSVDNEYRATYYLHDDCDGWEETYEAPVDVVEQPDLGLIDIKDAEISSTVGLADGEISASFGSEADGWVMTYAGRLDPPHLSYTIEDRFYSGVYNRWCTISLEVNGVTRYLDIPGQEP